MTVKGQDKNIYTISQKELSTLFNLRKGTFLKQGFTRGNLEVGLATHTPTRQAKSIFTLDLPVSLLRNAHLSSSNIVFQRMDGKAEDVIVMAKIQSLGVLLSTVYNSHSSNMVNYLPSLCVEQVVSTVIASVTEKELPKKKERKKPTKR